MNRRKPSLPQMDEKLQIDLANQIAERIKQADLCTVDITNGIADAINLDNGFLEHERDGEQTIIISLYFSEEDGRAKLYARCGSRAID